MTGLRSPFAPLFALAATALAVPTAARAQGGAAPTRAAVEELIARFDQAFNARRHEALVTLFLPIHREQTERTLERLRLALTGSGRLERHSELADSWTMGRHAIALVRATTACTTTKTEAREATLVAVREVGGALRIALTVDVDPGMLAMLPRERDAAPRGLLHCPACNYRIEAGEEWLTVPSRSQRVGCFESLSFWSLDHDLTVMVSVHLARAPEPAEQWLARLGVELGAGEHSAPQAWLPPRYAALEPRPTVLGGARATFSRPGDEQIVEASLATFGRVAWLFVARGSGAQCEAQRASLEELYGGFALDDLGLPAERLAASIEDHHLGARVHGADFEHAASGVRFHGPEGFSPTLASGFAAFDAAWTCPDGRSTLRLRGLRPPEGLAHWSSAAADAMLARTFARAELSPILDSGWQDGHSGFAKERRLGLRDAEGKLLRLLRVGLDEDLCVVLEVRTNGSLDAERGREVLERLSRRR